MVCVRVDPDYVLGRGCRPVIVMSLGSVQIEEVLAVLRDSCRRCAQHGMADVLSSTDSEPLSTESRLPLAILWPCRASLFK